VQVNGAAVCWGRNVEKQAGPPAHRFKAVSAGWTHTCGVEASRGRVVCWGSTRSQAHSQVLSKVSAPRCPPVSCVELACNLRWLPARMSQAAYLTARLSHASRSWTSHQGVHVSAASTHDWHGGTCAGDIGHGRFVWGHENVQAGLGLTRPGPARCGCAATRQQLESQRSTLKLGLGRFRSPWPA
jgi:hypothetical protein